MPIVLDTPDKLEYNFYPARTGEVKFKVRAPKDAHIALTTGPQESDPMLELIIGGWENTKSVVRRNRTKPDKVEVQTPDILNAGEFRGFWIRWFDSTLIVGREGEAAAFMTYDDPELIPIAYVGICTGWGATGSWIIEDTHAGGGSAGGWIPPPAGGGVPTWIPSRGGEVPAQAVAAGMDGEPVYIARAKHEGTLTPGKLVPSHGSAYVSWGGAEHAHTEYEVLCGCDGVWVPVHNGGEIPAQALPAGETEDGEPLFVGRVNHEGAITPGKVQPSHGKCYIPYGGQELGFEDFEVFVAN